MGIGLADLFGTFVRAAREKQPPQENLIITQAPNVVGLALFQGTPLWEASLWAKAFRRSVAERARLPQGTAMQGRALCRSGLPAELA